MGMRRVKLVLSLVLPAICAFAGALPVQILSFEGERSSARCEAVRYQDNPAIAVHFTGTDDLHYYADPATAPAPGLELNARGQGDGVVFGKTVFPRPTMFYEAASEKEIEVYVGDFSLVLPIEAFPDDGSAVTVSVHLAGIACTSKVCLPPFEKTLSLECDFSTAGAWSVIDFAAADVPAGPAPATPPEADPPPAGVPAAVGQSSVEMALMLLLAALAGLSFNIMPCVLPVLPLIASRMVNIARERPSRRIALGLTFCAGIVAFFVAVGVFSSVVRVTTGTVFNLSDPFRYPAFNITMALFLVLFALCMFDILPLSVPGAISGKTADASTFSGSMGMGFLAAILSIPCSGGILAAVLIWVQAQHWMMGFWAFLLMGVGMALPYAFIVMAPKLLGRIPKPGHWMEYFKKAMGFAMLVLAVKPLSGLPKARVLDVTVYAVVLAFCAWMWGTWVSFSAPAAKRWTVRAIAVLLAVAGGFWLLPEKKDVIAWQEYDRAVIQRAVSDNRPVLLKFTADWCTLCQILENRVFRDSETAAALGRRNFLVVKADTTQADDLATVDLQQVYGIPGTVPMTILLLPGRADDPVRLPGTYSKEDLFERIQEQ